MYCSLTYVRQFEGRNDYFPQVARYRRWPPATKRPPITFVQQAPLHPLKPLQCYYWSQERVVDARPWILYFRKRAVTLKKQQRDPFITEFLLCDFDKWYAQYSICSHVQVFCFEVNRPLVSINEVHCIEPRTDQKNLLQVNMHVDTPSPRAIRSTSQIETRNVQTPCMDQNKIFAKLLTQALYYWLKYQHIHRIGKYARPNLPNFSRSSPQTWINAGKKKWISSGIPTSMWTPRYGYNAKPMTIDVFYDTPPPPQPTID